MPHASAALSARVDHVDARWNNPNGTSDDRAREDLKSATRRLAAHCSNFKGSIPARSWTQIATTFIPLAALTAAMFYFVNTHYWLTLLLALPAGGMLVRVFIIQHDCGHGSFWNSRTWNDLTGRLMSVLTLAPYGLWRREHAQHHATSGNLDKRGVGDINTLTVKEYMALSPLQRLKYRIYRNPLFLFGFGVPFYFLFIQRLPWLHPYPARDTWKSVMALNLALVAVWGPVMYFTGVAEFFMVALPMLHVATAAGGWLFFVQHQFEETEWDSSRDWSFQVAALHGSSFYDLHPVLNWFTGNIGLHHIHHLNSTIPNYRLKDCLDSAPELGAINRITLRDSLQCARLKLWDEDRRRLISFDELPAA